MSELDLDKEKSKALEEARNVIKRFVSKKIKPDESLTLDLSQDFGYGVRTSDAVKSVRKLREEPYSQNGFRGPGAKWTEVHATDIPGIVIEQEYFKRPGDEINVQPGSRRLVKGQRAKI